MEISQNNDFIQQLGTVTSPSQRSIILEIIPWTQNAYTLLYHPGQNKVCLNKNINFYFISAQKVFSSLHNITIEPLMADGVSIHTFLDLLWSLNDMGVSEK